MSSKTDALGQMANLIMAGIGRRMDDTLRARAKGLLQAAGYAADDLDAEKLVKELRRNKIAINFTPDEFAESFPEASQLGFVPIPGYDYARDLNQLKALRKGPNADAVREAVRRNYDAADDMYTNPLSPVYRRIVGDEKDPIAAMRKIQDARLKNESFYDEWSEDALTNYGGLDPVTAIGAQAPLSRGSGPAAEMLSFSNMVENPERMFDIPSDIDPALRAQYGNSGTTYGGPSLLASMRVGMEGRRWLQDPYLLSSKGDILKTGMYSRNKVAPGSAFILPVGKRRAGNRVVPILGKARPATLDRQANVAALGGIRPLGSSIIGDQETYNYLMDILTEAATARNLTPDRFQARIWYPVREFLNDEVGGGAPIGRLFQPDQRAIDAFGVGKNDPRGMVEAAERASDARLQADLSRATDKAERNKAKKQHKKRTTDLQKIRKSDPRLMAILAMLGGGTAGGMGLAGGGDDQTNLDALGKMS